MVDIQIPLDCATYCRVENRIYFMSSIFNGLFCLDINDLSVHFVHRFSCGQASAQNLSSCSFFYGNTVYCFPNQTNVVMEYDISKQKEHIIPIQGYSGEFFQTVAAIRKEHRIYMFPYNLGEGIYRFDLMRNKTEKDEELSLLFSSDSYCGNVELVHDKFILIGMDRSDRIMEIDLDAKKVVHSKILGKGIQIYSIYSEGNDCWILPMFITDIYQWNREDDTLEIYKNEHAVWEEAKQVPYASMIFLEDEILVLNAHLKNIMRINKEKKTIEDTIPFPKGFRLNQGMFRFRAVCGQYTALKNIVLLYPGRGNMLLIYDKKSKSLAGKEWLVSEKEVPSLREMLQEILVMDNGNWQEMETIKTLDNYVAVIEADKSRKEFGDNPKIGQTIYGKNLER